MGSHLSCVSPADPRHRSSSNAHLGSKVLDPESGRILEFDSVGAHEQQPVTVAELMMDFPGHFVCHFSSWNALLQLALSSPHLQPHPHPQPQPQPQPCPCDQLAGCVTVNDGYLGVAKRLAPLPADDELKAGELYLLLPIAKLHSRASPRDLTAFAHAFLILHRSSTSCSAAQARNISHNSAAAAAASTFLSSLRLGSKSFNAKYSLRNKIAPLISSSIRTTTAQLPDHAQACFSAKASIQMLISMACADAPGDQPHPPTIRSLSFNSLPRSYTNHLLRDDSLDSHDAVPSLPSSQGIICRSKSWIPKLDTITEVPTSNITTVAF